MKSFGLTSSFKIGDVEYYIETECKPERGFLVTKVVRDGAVINYKKQKVSKEIEENELMELIRDLHLNTIENFKKWGEISENFLKDAPAEVHVKMAEKLLKMGFMEQAEKHLKKAVERDDRYSSAYKVYALYHMFRDEYNKAFKHIVRALEISPHYPDYYLLMGKVLIKLDKEKEALRFIQEAIKRVPSYAEAHYEELKAFLKMMLKGISFEKEKILAKIKALPIMDPRLNCDEYKQALKLFKKEDLKGCLDNLESMEKIFYHNYPQEIIKDFSLLSKVGIKDKITLREYILKLEELLEEKDDYPDLYFAISKSYLLYIKELFEKAHYYLRKSLDLNPHYLEAKKVLELLENEIKGFLIFLKATER